MNEVAAWPPGVRAAVDCIPLLDTDTLQEGDIVWNNRNRIWAAAGGTVGRTVADMRRQNNILLAGARPTFSRTNPPPLEEGHILLEPHEVAFDDARFYRVGRGWVSEDFMSGYTLGQCDSTVLAIARPAITQTLPVPDGFVLVEHGSIDPQNILTRAFRAMIRDEWVAIAAYSYNQIGHRPLIRRDISVGNLPITVLSGGTTIQTGDLAFDADGGWLPFIGEPLPVYDYISDHILAIARLNEEFRPATHQLRSMHVRISANHELLRRNDEGVWSWSPAVEPLIGQLAYMVPGVIGLRLPVQAGVRRVPVDAWMAASLVAMLNSEPDAEVFRGLVRRDYRLIIPRELHASGNVEAIKAWLEEAYAAAHPDEERVSFLRVHDMRRREEVRREILTRPVVQHGEDRVIIEFVALEDVSRRDYRTDRVSGSISIPRNIFDRGEGSVMQYINEHYRDADMDGGRTEGDWHEGETDYDLDHVTSTNWQDVRNTLGPAEEDEDEPDNNF